MSSLLWTSGGRDTRQAMAMELPVSGVPSGPSLTSPAARVRPRNKVETGELETGGISSSPGLATFRVQKPYFSSRNRRVHWLLRPEPRDCSLVWQELGAFGTFGCKQTWALRGHLDKGGTDPASLVSRRAPAAWAPLLTSPSPCRLTFLGPWGMPRLRVALRSWPQTLGQGPC